MKNLLVAIMLMVVSTGAMAGCDLSGVDGLSAVKVAELELACNVAKEAAKAASSGVSIVNGIEAPSGEALSAYAIAAQEWAKAIGIAAKELGIAADEFLGTTTGKLTAAIIIMNVFGETVVGILIGIPLLLVIIVATIKIANRSALSEITYSETAKTWRGKPVVLKVKHFDLSDNGGYWITIIVGLLLSAITVGTVIL